MARGTIQDHRAQLHALCFRGSAKALSTTQSRPDEERFDCGGRQRRRLFWSESLVDGSLGAHPVSRLVLSTRDAGVAAHHQTRGFADLAEPLPDRPRCRTQQVTRWLRCVKRRPTGFPRVTRPRPSSLRLLWKCFASAGTTKPPCAPSLKKRACHSVTPTTTFARRNI